MNSNRLLLIAALAFLFLPIQTFAKFCACCSEKGEYSIRVTKPTEYEIGELKRLQIVDATLFTDAGYPDNILGITPLTENFTANFSIQSSIWKFAFQGDGKNTGILNLAQAPTFVDFKADIHDGGEGDPLLYKEMRFKYKVKSGAGIFANGIVPMTEYFLVFQGRGNNCMNAEDFTHWRLEITGKKANYAFFGKLKTTEK